MNAHELLGVAERIIRLSQEAQCLTLSQAKNQRLFPGLAELKSFLKIRIIALARLASNPKRRRTLHSRAPHVGNEQATPSTTVDEILSQTGFDFQKANHLFSLTLVFFVPLTSKKVSDTT